MNQQDPPKIEFPCDYPIKVIGDGADDFKDLVASIVADFDPKFDPACITLNPSRNGTFVSVRVSIWATGPDQLDALHKALRSTGRVKMVI